jgi:hypothetical protein
MALSIAVRRSGLASRSSARRVSDPERMGDRQCQFRIKSTDGRLVWAVSEDQPRPRPAPRTVYAADYEMVRITPQARATGLAAFSPTDSQVLTLPDIR